VRLSVFLLIAACSSASGQDADADETPETPEVAPAQRAVRVEVVTVQPSEATIRTRLPGEVEGSRDAMLASSMGGYVERVLVSEGEEVRQGQLLIRVDSALHGAQAAQARVEVEAAERELARSQRLQGSIAQAQIDNAETRVAAARAALRTAQVTAARTRVTAPFAGVVASLDIERGEVAAPGAPMLRLVQLDPAIVNLAVPDRDVVALEEGMEVHVQSASAGIRTGHVSHIGAAADMNTRAFSVDVQVDNADRKLLPGMIAQVQLVRPVATERVVIPQYVLVTRLEGNGVFVAAEGTASWRPVETGAVVRDQVVIESGIDAGARVIVTGHRELADGDPVLVSREGTCCTEGRVTF